MLGYTTLRDHSPRNKACVGGNVAEKVKRKSDDDYQGLNVVYHKMTIPSQQRMQVSKTIHAPLSRMLQTGRLFG